MADQPTGRATSATLLLAGAAVALEGLALVVLGCVAAGVATFGDPGDRGIAWLSAVLGVVSGLALLVAARGLLRFRRAAYAPVVLAEVLAVPVGISLLQSGRTAVGVVLLVVAVAVLVLLLLTKDGHALLEHGE